jgi:hypothetical protein
LARESAEVLSVYQGGNELEIRVDEEYEIIMRNVSNLTVVAGSYLESNNRQLERLRTDMERYRQPGRQASRQADVINQISALENILPRAREITHIMEGMDLSSRDAGYLTEIGGNIDASLRKISLSGYYTQAAKFNDLIRNPYTAFIAGLRGIKEYPDAQYRLY